MTQYSMCEGVDQPDMESNIGIQEGSEWPRIELIPNG